MHGSTGKFGIGQAARTYAAVFSSRDGGVMIGVWLKQRFPGGYDAQRSNWSSAILRKYDILEDVLQTDVETLNFQNKISATYGIGKSANRYAAQIGSRNGGCVSQATLRFKLFEDAIV